MDESFNNTTAQGATAAFGAVIVVLGVACIAGGLWVGVGYVLLGGGFMWRGIRSSCVVIRNGCVETRSMVRTRRFPIESLERVEVAIGTTGMNGFGREYLVLHRHGGGPVAFKELNAKPPHHDTEPSPVRLAAEHINQVITTSTDPQPPGTRAS